MKSAAWLLAISCLLSTSTWASAPTASDYKVTHRYALGGPGGWDYLTLDPVSNRLFIARDDRVMVVDAGSGRVVAEIPGMQHAHGVAIAPDRRAYISNGHGNNVSIVDLNTLRVTGHIPVSGKNPDAIIYESASKHILAMNGDSNSISVIDTDAGKELTTIALAGNPEFAVSDGNGNVYVNLEDKGKLAHVDMRANVVLDTWPLAPCEGPTGLALDSANKRLFSVCANGWLIVTDAINGHQIAKLPIGKEPDAVGYDAATHTIFSSSREGVLNVIRQNDADHYVSLAAVPTMKSARTLAIDPKSHEIFLVGATTAGKNVPVNGFTMLVVGHP